MIWYFVIYSRYFHALNSVFSCLIYSIIICHLVSVPICPCCCLHARIAHSRNIVSCPSCCSLFVFDIFINIC